MVAPLYPLPIPVRLRVELALHGRSEREVARAAGITIGTLSRILNGRTPGAPETLARIEEAIRRPPEAQA
jgi:transcriptional regulator with XRE-family HTH domain